MRVSMDVKRAGAQYQGSLTRVSDQLCVPFAGVLELLAALERLDPEQLNPSDPSDADDGPARNRRPLDDNRSNP